MFSLLVIITFYALNAYIKVDSDWKTKYAKWHKDPLFVLSLIGAMIADLIIFFSSNVN